MRGRGGGDDRRGRSLYAGRARGGGRHRRDRGGDRPHARRDQPGLRGERGDPALGPGGAVRGALHRVGLRLDRPRPSRGSVGRPPGRGARSARPGRGGPRAPCRRRVQCLRYSPPPRRVRPHRLGLRWPDVRARARSQHGALSRPVPGAAERRWRAVCRTSSGVRLREPADIRAERPAVGALEDDHVLRRLLQSGRRRVRGIASFLECDAALRRRPVGRRPRLRRVGRRRPGRRGGRP